MQADLFDFHTAPVSHEKTRPHVGGDRFRVTFNLEQALVGFIVLIVMNSFVFAWGVERGKAMARQAVAEAVSAADSGSVAGRSSPSDPSETTASGEETSVQQEAGAPQENKGEAGAQEVNTPNQAVIAASEPPAASGNYTIQVATYRTKSAAERFIRKLSEKGFHSFTIPSGGYIQVCVDRFETFFRAKQVLADLKVSGLAPSDAYVRPLKSLN